MKKYKGIALAGLVCVFALLSAPATALATTGTAVPISTHTKATYRINLRTGAISGTGAGQGSPIGNFRDTLNGHSRSKSGTFYGWGTLTVTAENGDLVYATFNLAIPEPISAGTTGTTHITITGGTGRFQGATGTATEECQLSAPVMDTVLMTIEADCTATGSISSSHGADDDRSGLHGYRKHQPSRG